MKIRDKSPVDKGCYHFLPGFAVQANKNSDGCVTILQGLLSTQVNRGGTVGTTLKTDLGAWEDIPRRLSSEDLSTLDVEAGDAFVLTRIDGRTATADLCNITGLGERKTLEALERLLTASLVSITEATGSRTLIKIRRKATKTAPPSPKFDAFHGVAPDLARWLNAQGTLGQIPGQRIRGKGANRYGGMSFDSDLLKQVDWLTVERKKEIVFLASHREKVDHFEFLGIEPTSDKRTIRNAFSDFSRKFHPDTVFRKEIGPFRESIEAIFKYGTQVYEWLSTDETVRTRYVEAINQRDETIRSTHFIGMGA